MTKLQRGRSAIATTPEITNIRSVTRADLAHLATPRSPNQIQTLRDNHHRMARAIAGGLSNAEVAATCGVSVGRVSLLRADPSFIDLVAHYRAVLTSEWAQADTVIEFMRTNALKAQAMISDKLDDAAVKNEFLPTRDLLGIAELGLDRTGYGKVNKNININVDFAAKLEAARNRSSRADSARVIEASPTLAPQSEPNGLDTRTSVHSAPAFRRI